MQMAAMEARVAFSTASLGGMFGLFFAASAPRSYTEMMQCDRDRFNRFFHAMLRRGIYLAPSAFEAGFVSAAHTPEDIATTVECARAAFADGGNT
jgi:glutamate-1-semialdehyde 2,1-aminomutase